MKKLLFLLGWLVGFQYFNANAAITVTPGSGGTGICSNRAQTGPSPAFTTLGNIVITEGVNADITAGFHTLVLAAPAGWRFLAGSTITVTPTGSDIAFATSGGVTATNITINILALGTANINTITIGGVQVQATSTASAAGNITASNNGGIGTIVVGTTNFGSLSLTTALVPSVTIAAAPAGAICSGTNVTFTATPVNGGATPTYQWSVAGVPVAGATNSTFSSSTLANGNTVRVTMTSSATCVNPASANSANITMVVNATPAAVTVTGGGTYCNNTTLTASGGAGGTIYFQGAVYNGTSTTTASSSEFITTPGTFTYYFRSRSGAGCWGPQGSDRVTINLPPSAITITPATTASICLGDSGTFIASATAPNNEVLYEDFDGAAAGWTITNTSGTSASYWQLRTPSGWNNYVPGGGTQYMEAAPDATGSGITTTTVLTSPSFSLDGYTSATLTFNQVYLMYAADINVSVDYSTDGGASWTTFINQLGATTGTTSWVASTPTTSVALPAGALDQPNVMLRWNYSSTWGWYWAIDNVAVTGTPRLTFDWVGVSGASGLSCSTCDTVTITPATAGVNVYSVSSTVSGCTALAGLTVTANPLPNIYSVSGGGTLCAGDAGFNVILSGSDPGIDYQLYVGSTPVGAPMAGTGTALDFGPQTTPGTYTISAANPLTACTVAMSGSADIIVNPAPVDYPMSGGGTYCAGDPGAHIGIVGSDIGISYQLFEGTTPVGSPLMGTGGALDYGIFTSGGPFIVIATDTATGCSDTMTGSATVTASPLPVSFNVMNDGSYCSGDPGVDVFIVGSDMGVDYQLFNGSVPVGAPVPGTGMAIDFGPQTAGVYTVLATNTTTGCTNVMNDSAVIIEFPAPIVAPITGSTSVLCAGQTTLLSDATAGGSWSSSDASIATISGGGILTGVSAGAATITYTVSASAGCSRYVTYPVTIGNAMPATGISPAAPSITMCGGSPVVLVATLHSGINYQWTLGGVDIAGATDNSYTATAPGIYAVRLDNGTCTVTLPSKTVLADPMAVISYNSTGNFLYTGSFTTYQWFLNGTAIAGATTSMYFSPAPGDYTVVVSDANGCVDTSAKFTFAPSSVNGVTVNMDVKVYPNPASSTLYIDAPVKVSVSVVTPDGRLVMDSRTTTSINVSALANGVYMLLVHDENNVLLKAERFTKIN